MPRKGRVIGGLVGLICVFQKLSDPRGAFIMKGLAGTCIVYVAALTHSSLEAQRGGEDVGMLTSASQRFNLKKTVESGRQTTALTSKRLRDM